MMKTEAEIMEIGMILENDKIYTKGTDLLELAGTEPLLGNALNAIGNSELELKALTLTSLNTFKILSPRGDYAILETTVSGVKSGNPPINETRHVQLIHPYGTYIAYYVAKDFKI